MPQCGVDEDQGMVNGLQLTLQRSKLGWTNSSRDKRLNRSCCNLRIRVTGLAAPSKTKTREV